MNAAETRLAVLLALMRQLQEVMRAENGLLRDLKLARLRELQEEKSALAGHYELELRRLRQSPEVLSSLGGEARRLLEGSMREFQASVRANADRLAQARSVVEAVVQAIGQSLSAESGQTPRYGAGPQAAADPLARVIPVAFDRRC
jgi:hypothetical protein